MKNNPLVSRRARPFADVPRQAVAPSGDGALVLSLYGDEAAWARGSVVLMCHGFTGNRMECRRIFVRLARELTEAGLAVATFDYRGNGESTGEFEEMTVATLLDDAEAALDRVRDEVAAARTATPPARPTETGGKTGTEANESNRPNRPNGPMESGETAGADETDGPNAANAANAANEAHETVPAPIRVGVLGFSMGGLVASYLAHRRRRETTCVVLWAAVACSTRVLNGILGCPPGEALRRFEFPLDRDGWRIGRRFLEELETTCSSRVLAEAGRPVLLLHARDDKTVDLDNAREFAAALTRAGVEHRMELLPRGGHGFSVREIERELFDKTLDFFKRKLR